MNIIVWKKYRVTKGIRKGQHHIDDWIFTHTETLGTFDDFEEAKKFANEQDLAHAHILDDEGRDKYSFGTHLTHNYLKYWYDKTFTDENLMQTWIKHL